VFLNAGCDEQVFSPKT